MTTTRSKATRLLAGGRVHVPDVVRVTVDGDTARWEVTWDGREWCCPCPGFTYRHTCSHVVAVALLTLPPPLRWSRQEGP